MIIRTEGQGGAFADVLARYRVVELPHDRPINIETLDGGMSDGAASVAFIFELPGERIAVLAQTSLKLFQMAAAATLAKYGDVTGGGYRAYIDGNTAKLHMESLANCPRCDRDIFASSRYCQHCGSKL